MTQNHDLDRAEARVYLVAEMPGVEQFAIVRYSPDGLSSEIDAALLVREHPEVPCTTAARNKALLEAGWNTVGSWSVHGPDQARISVQRRRRYTSGEHLPRPLGSYDPMEPMIIPYGDLIAARNAVSNLVLILRDEVDPPSEFQQESVRTGIRFSVTPDGQSHVFDTFPAAVEWLVELRDRLRGLLPDLPPGRV